MYKRLFYATLATLTFTLVFSAFVVMNAYADRPITVYVDGKKVEFPDAQPQMIDGRIFVPIRFVSEALGATVERDAKTNSVFITSPNPQTNQPEQNKESETETTIKASVGEVIELPNAKVKVKELVDSQTQDGKRLVTVYFDIYTDAEPKTSFNWMIGDFLDAFVLSDGREIRSYGLSEPYIIPGQWNEKHAGLQDLDKKYDVVAVIVKDPIDLTVKALVEFQ